MEMSYEVISNGLVWSGLICSYIYTNNHVDGIGIECFVLTFYVHKRINQFPVRGHCPTKEALR